MALTISATNTEAQKPVNVIYQETLLRNARPRCPYYVGSTPGVLRENMGSASLAWRRYNTSADDSNGIAPTTTALSELITDDAYGQGRSSDVVHFSAVEAVVSKYGQYFILNEEVDTFLPNGTMMGITRTLAISAGRSLNYLQRNIIEDNATIVYTSGNSSDVTTDNKISNGAIDTVIVTLDNNSANTFTPESTGSTNVGTNPQLPGYWGLCHGHVAYDIEKLAGFKSVETYAGQLDTATGEFGSITTAGTTVRWISSPDASIDLDLGAAIGSTGMRGTSAVNLYTSVIFGQDAIGSAGLGKAHSDGIYKAGDSLGSIEMIHKPRGSAGSGDPFNEISTIAWKAWHGGAILNANWVRGIRSGATSIST